MSNPNQKVKAIAGTCVAFLLAVLSVAATSSGQPTADQQAVETVIQQRMTLMQAFGASTDGTLAASALTSAKASANAQLADVYVGDLLATRQKQMDDALAAQSSGQVYLYGGGTSSLEFLSIRIDGDTATAVVQATTWSLVGQSVNGQVVTARPSNTETFNFALVRGTNGWRIDDESLQFEPGSEP